MSYQITIKTESGALTYTAIGDRNKLMDAAYDAFGICALSIKPL